MYRAISALPISDLRTRQAEILEQVGHAPVMLTHRGVGAGILVSPEQWNAMVELLEDYEDALIATERKCEADAAPIIMRPIGDLRTRLQTGGLLDE